MADRRADAGELGRRDRRADARAADEDPALGPAALDRLAHLAGEVGVVDAYGVGVDAEVDDVVAGGLDRRDDRVAKLDAPVVERDRDLHARYVTQPTFE